MAGICEKCSTPLGDGNRCVTCDADAEGLKLITRSGYASVREMMSLLESQGLGPEMEKVPPARPEEKMQPLWNLYVPEAEVEQAVTFLRRDWAALLDDPDAAQAAARGLAGIDVDAGGEVTCPACGHAFTLSSGEAECPECGLALGAPANASPDEAQSKS
jgi:nitrite reductase/ring-hydroxylating ferredoxin subunit